MDADFLSRRELMLAAYLDFCAAWGAFQGSVNYGVFLDELFFAGIVLTVAGSMTWAAAEGELPLRFIVSRMKQAMS